MQVLAGNWRRKGISMKRLFDFVTCNVVNASFIDMLRHAVTGASVLV